MAICKFYAQGYCKFGDRCRFEHANQGGFRGNQSFGARQQLDFGNNSFGGGKNVGFTNQTPTVQEILNTVTQEIDTWEKSKMWPLSCFGYQKYVPSFPGLEDYSMEEVRLKAYETQKSGNIAEYNQWLNNLVSDASSKKQELKRPSAVTRPKLISLIETLNKSTGSGDAGSSGGTAFGSSSSSNLFGKSNFGSNMGGMQSSTFGGSAGTGQTAFGSSFASGNKGQSAFGGSSSATPLGGSAFGGSAPSQNKGVFGGSSTTAGQSAFGGMASGQSLFGKSSTGQSAFGGSSTGQSAFGGSTGQSAFGGTSGQSAFGSAQSTNSPFGGSTGQSAFGGNNAGQSTFGGNASQFGGGGVVKPSAFGSTAFGQPQTSQNTQFGAQPANAAGSTGFSFAQSQTSSSDQNLFGKQSNTAGAAPSNSVAGAFGSSAPANPLAQTGFGAATTQPSQPQPAAGLFTKPATAPATQTPAAASVTAVTQPSNAGNKGGVYSSLDQLTTEERAQFEAEKFTPGKIPTKPPPQELCF